MSMIGCITEIRLLLRTRATRWKKWGSLFDGISVNVANKRRSTLESCTPSLWHCSRVRCKSVKWDFQLRPSPTHRCWCYAKNDFRIPQNLSWTNFESDLWRFLRAEVASLWESPAHFKRGNPRAVEKLSQLKFNSIIHNDIIESDHYSA
jgi:hypothetical protein